MSELATTASAQTNPLLSFIDLPPFSAIQPEHIKPAVEQAIATAQAAVERVVSATEVSWHSLITELEQDSDRLSKLWSPVSHLNSVANSPELRAAYESCLPLLSDFSTWLGQHEGLYQKYLQLHNSSEFASLSSAQQKVITNALRDFKLSGIGLPAEKKQRYGEIQSRLSDLSSTFSNNTLDATQAWFKHITDAAELAGLPEDAKLAAAEEAQSRELSGWVFTLEFPSYIAVMTYADNQALRQELYSAYCTRASDQGPTAGQFDNTAIIAETLALKHELAQLLDFANAAEESLATKMAESPQQVLAFLTDLARRAKPQAERDLLELKQFAKEQYGATELNAWDVTYYAEKLKEARYAVSDEQLRPYFPATKVVPGLFTVLNKLFGIRVKVREGVDVWHPDVQFYDIFAADGTLRGSFYLDLYARSKKRGGAWMDDCRGRRILANGELQSPVAYLTCNFNKPVAGKPALFTHDEVITLFHEFGHGLHHMLTQVDAAAVAGINGVAWDAVELPSQFLENWCWTPEALALISGHYETGEPLPEDLLQKVLAAKNFQSALFLIRQLEFALFDMRLHAEYQPETAASAELGDKVQQLLDEVRTQVSVIVPPRFNRFQHSFSHIFAGGYAAGYYSYLWAEVLSADAFGRFEEEGVFNPATGQDFLHWILERGGSAEPMELFKGFRGREPSNEALLRHMGIAS
ncbi:oligopeptidase A [Alishewanella longhuensis]|uniref:oligopeptidase A n=1 Tax=Alishewanella longhuensis TaxID=1091037 RepID=A0ABQ3L138_9ALTE|nr:oligopeptidase A [Alishewanella longhuensis]GHG72560.1 oligopeptidase A [Alishewanella longhuensis]